MVIAERLAEGFAALRAGEPAKAAELLEAVCADPTFAAQSDLRDLFARASSLHAQALLQAGEPAKAARPLRAAIDTLKTLDDQDGLAQVQQLEQQIGQAIAEDFSAMARRRQHRDLAQASLQAVVATAKDGSARAEIAIKWSDGALTDGRPADAAIAAAYAAEQAEQAGDIRNLVFACIAWARADSQAAARQLEFARDAADAADETNLVAAVAKSAESLGIVLHPPPST